MKYSKEFLEANARLKTLDEETLNDELNKMSFDELLEHRDYMIQQELGEENQLSEEEAQEQIEELLQMTREPSTDEIQPIKIHTHRTGKRIAVLIAAILIMVSVFTVAAVASKRDFSILNGIVRFEDGKVYISFLDTDKSMAMNLVELETDLQNHGFSNIRMPNYFYEGAWMTKNVGYLDQDLVKQVTFNLSNGEETYTFNIATYKNSDYSKDTTFKGVEEGETIQNGEIIVYLFNHGNGLCEILYFVEDTTYRITANITLDKMRVVASTIM